MITNTVNEILVFTGTVLAMGIVIGFFLCREWDSWWDRRKLNELRRRHRRLVKRALEYNLRIQDVIR